MMIEKNGKIAVRRQCMLLNLNRSKIYYCNKKPNTDNEILKLIENIHEEIPIYGYRKITHELRININYRCFQQKNSWLSNVADSELWREAIEELQLTVSMDGKGRWADNVYIERFWRTIKYETALLERFKHINDVKKHIQQFVYFYNFKRLHQNLNYNTPNNVYNKIVDGHSFIYAKVEKKRSQK